MRRAEGAENRAWELMQVADEVRHREWFKGFVPRVEG